MRSSLLRSSRWGLWTADDRDHALRLPARADQASPRRPAARQLCRSGRRSGFVRAPAVVRLRGRPYVCRDHFQPIVSADPGGDIHPHGARLRSHHDRDRCAPRRCALRSGRRESGPGGSDIRPDDRVADPGRRRCGGRGPDRGGVFALRGSRATAYRDFERAILVDLFLASRSHFSTSVSEPRSRCSST
jgi:hypothetical protein